MKNLTVREFFQLFKDDNTCLDYVMEARFGLTHTCSNCGKEANFYKLKNRKAYSCEYCGSHVYPCAGTLFEGSRTPLQLWFYAIYLFSTSRHGVSAKELERQLGVTYKCAWRMGHEIRKHMSLIDGDEPLSGHVEVDETFVGGKMAGGMGGKGKTVIFGMLERDGDVITKIVPNTKKVTLRPIIHENVEKGSKISSDEHGSYKSLKRDGYDHGAVAHGRGEYVNGEVHVNGIEGYWARLKNSIAGTHVHVSRKHLDKYTGEFEYRFNSRKNPEKMFPELISIYPEQPDEE
jgi:transposase